MVSVWQLNFDSIGIKIDIWCQIVFTSICSPSQQPFFHSTLILESFPIIGILLYYSDPSLLYGSFSIIRVPPNIVTPLAHLSFYKMSAFKSPFSNCVIFGSTNEMPRSVEIDQSETRIICLGIWKNCSFLTNSKTLTNKTPTQNLDEWET